MATLNKTIAFISGANQGIGLATAKRLAAEHNYHVIIGSRNIENGRKAADQLKSEGLSVDSIQLDLQSDDSITAAAAYVAENYGHLDVLINNAGVLLDGGVRGEMSTRKLYDTTLSTNVTGTVCLTEALSPLLRKSTQRPRLIFVTSVMGSLTVSSDSSTPFYPLDYRAYDASKAAINILTINYARILADKNALVNAVCPGLVSTNLTRYMEAGTTPEVGAQRVVEMAAMTGKGTDITGTFSNKDGSLPW